MPPRGRTSGTLALVAAWLAGTLASATVAYVLWNQGETCLDFASEGPTAAPGSAYSAVMCGPFPVPLRWSVLWVLVASWLALLLLASAWRRRGGAARYVAALLGLLLVPPLLQLVQHVALPRDCLSGREDSGSCARDREDTFPR